MNKRQQVTEIEESSVRSAGRTTRSALNQPLPTWLVRTLMVVFGVLVVLGISGFGKYHIYQKYFRESIPAAELSFDALDASLTEADILARFARQPMRCTFQDVVANGGMGDRVCFTALNTANGHPALTAGFFFVKGKLNLALLHVPWWAHGRAMEATQRKFGPGAIAPDGLRAWKLTHGKLEMNQRRSLNPLSWSALVWTKQRGN